MTITLISIFILLLLSAFFSSSETALTSTSKHIIHRLEQQSSSIFGEWQAWVRFPSPDTDIIRRVFASRTD